MSWRPPRSNEWKHVDSRLTLTVKVHETSDPHLDTQCLGSIELPWFWRCRHIGNARLISDHVTSAICPCRTADVRRGQHGHGDFDGYDPSRTPLDGRDHFQTEVSILVDGAYESLSFLARPDDTEPRGSVLLSSKHDNFCALTPYIAHRLTAATTPLSLQTLTVSASGLVRSRKAEPLVMALTSCSRNVRVCTAQFENFLNIGSPLLIQHGKQDPQEVIS